MRYELILLGLLVTGTAQALDCQTPPDCASLGYASEDDPSCAQDGYVYCPFDENYKKCVNYDCAKLGFTEDDKTSWCNKLAKCKGNAKMTLCQNLCEIGDVYYTDGTCGYVEDYDGSKTPVGVVYYVTDNGRHGKVINLHDLGRNSSGQFDPKDPYNASYTYFERNWSGNIEGLKLWDCNTPHYTEVAKTGDHNNDFWSAGMIYTKTIASYKKDLKYPESATLAFYPHPDLKTDWLVGEGHWYLPTLGELMDLYGYNYPQINPVCTGTSGTTGTTKITVNATLQALADKQITAKILTESYYWSSSLYTHHSSWRFNMKDGARPASDNTNTVYIRASLEF